MHLLEYKTRMYEYLRYFKKAKQNPFKRNDLLNFSSITDKEGYNDSFLTNDLITTLYIDFVARGRKTESIEYCKTRIGKRLYFMHILAFLNHIKAKSLSMDNTFKSASKASIIVADGQRHNPLKGGILSAINEEGEGLSWVRSFQFHPLTMSHFYPRDSA